MGHDREEAHCRRALHKAVMLHAGRFPKSRQDRAGDLALELMFSVLVEQLRGGELEGLFVEDEAIFREAR